MRSLDFLKNFRRKKTPDPKSEKLTERDALVKEKAAVQEHLTRLTSEPAVDVIAPTSVSRTPAPTLDLSKSIDDRDFQLALEERNFLRIVDETQYLISNTLDLFDQWDKQPSYNPELMNEIEKSIKTIEDKLALVKKINHPNPSNEIKRIIGEIADVEKDVVSWKEKIESAKMAHASPITETTVVSTPATPEAKEKPTEPKTETNAVDAEGARRASERIAEINTEIHRLQNPQTYAESTEDNSELIAKLDQEKAILEKIATHEVDSSSRTVFFTPEQARALRKETQAVEHNGLTAEEEKELADLDRKIALGENLERQRKEQVENIPQVQAAKKRLTEELQIVSKKEKAQKDLALLEKSPLEFFQEQVEFHKKFGGASAERMAKESELMVLTLTTINLHYDREINNLLK